MELDVADPTLREVKGLPGPEQVRDHRRHFPNRTGSGGLIDVVAFGEWAESKLDLLSSGQHLLVVGRLNLRHWQTSEGKKRTRTEIIATDLRSAEETNQPSALPKTNNGNMRSTERGEKRRDLLNVIPGHKEKTFMRRKRFCTDKKLARHRTEILRYFITEREKSFPKDPETARASERGYGCHERNAILLLQQSNSCTRTPSSPPPIVGGGGFRYSIYDFPSPRGRRVAQVILLRMSFVCKGTESFRLEETISFPKKAILKREASRPWNTKSASPATYGEPKDVESIMIDRNLSCTFVKAVGESGKLFGSVTSMEIESYLKENGIDVDRKKIQLDEPIKNLGMFTVPIKLLPEVTAHLKVWVVQE
jgi:ribosomal protein L9